MSIQTTLIAAGVAAALSVASVAAIKHEHDLLVKRDGELAAMSSLQVRTFAALTADRIARTTEQAAAVAALAAAGKTCDARVAAARRATTAIKTIVEKPHATDANHCPVPDVVPAGELRNALQPGS